MHSVSGKTEYTPNRGRSFLHWLASMFRTEEQAQSTGPNGFTPVPLLSNSWDIVGRCNTKQLHCRVCGRPARALL